MTHWDQGAWRNAKTCQVCKSPSYRGAACLISPYNSHVLWLTLGMQERKGLTSMLVSMTLSWWSPRPRETARVPSRRAWPQTKQNRIETSGCGAFTGWCMARPDWSMCCFRTLLQPSPRTASRDWWERGNSLTVNGFTWSLVCSG